MTLEEQKMELVNCLHTMWWAFIGVAMIDNFKAIDEFTRAKEVAHNIIADIGREETP